MTQRFTLAEAAAELKAPSPRWLAEWLRAHPRDNSGEPFYTPMGRDKVFRSDDIARMEPEISRARLRPTFIYFVEQCGFIKIGFSDNWAKRISSIQNATPFRVRRLIVIKSIVGHEAELHEKFAHHHVRGEWFTDTPEIRKVIDLLNSSPLLVAGAEPE